MVRRPRIAKVQLNSATGRVVGATGVAPSPEWVTGVPGGASVAVTEDCEDPVEVDDGGARGWPRMSQSLTFRQNAGTGPGQAPVSLPAGLGGAVGHRTDAGHLLVGAGRRAAGGGGVCRGAAGDGGEIRGPLTGHHVSPPSLLTWKVRGSGGQGIPRLVARRPRSVPGPRRARGRVASVIAPRRPPPARPAAPDG